MTEIAERECLARLATATAEIQRISKAVQQNPTLTTIIANCGPASQGLGELIERWVVSLDKTQPSPETTARRAQTWFKRLAYAAASLVFLSSVFGNYVLYAGRPTPGGAALSGVSALHLGLAVVGIAIAWFVSWRDFHGNWFRNRAQAEEKRLEHYEFVLASRVNVSVDHSAALRFEYVREFLLDGQHGQRAFFQDRKAKARGVLARLRLLRSIAYIAIAAIALPHVARGITAYWPAGLANPWIQWSVTIAINQEQLCTFVGLVGTAAIALLAAFGSISLAARNAKKYAEMKTFLDDVHAEHVPWLRNAASRGDAQSHASIMEFWTDLRSILEREHKDWLDQSMQNARSVLADLKRTVSPELGTDKAP